MPSIKIPGATGQTESRNMQDANLIAGACFPTMKPPHTPPLSTATLMPAISGFPPNQDETELQTNTASDPSIPISNLTIQ
jgi:hypothetical protein